MVKVKITANPWSTRPKYQIKTFNLTDFLRDFLKIHIVEVGVVQIQN